MRYALVAALLMVAACGSEKGPTITDFTHIGTWQLSSVQDKALPVVLATSNTACGVTVENGTLTLRENGTYRLEVNYGPKGCEAEYVTSGPYTIANDRDLSLQAASTTIQMAYFGIIIDWTRNGVLYSFSKP